MRSKKNMFKDKQLLSLIELEMCELSEYKYESHR